MTFVRNQLRNAKHVDNQESRISMPPTTAFTIASALLLGPSPLAADRASGEQPPSTGQSVLFAEARADSLARFQAALQRFGSTV